MDLTPRPGENCTGCGFDGFVLPEGEGRRRDGNQGLQLYQARDECRGIRQERHGLIRGSGQGEIKQQRVTHNSGSSCIILRRIEHSGVFRAQGDNKLSVFAQGETTQDIVSSTGGVQRVCGISSGSCGNEREKTGFLTRNTHHQVRIKRSQASIETALGKSRDEVLGNRQPRGDHVYAAPASLELGGPLDRFHTRAARGERDAVIIAGHSSE